MPQQPPAIPAAPAAPSINPGQITVSGAPIASAYDVYQAFRAQRRVLEQQMDNLQGQRDNLSRELQQEGVTGADRKGIEQRITSIDERIASLDKQIAEADAQTCARREPPTPSHRLQRVPPSCCCTLVAAPACTSMRLLAAP